MIEIDGLTKRYGDKTAVDDLSFTVRPGTVTGFLFGPYGQLAVFAGYAAIAVAAGVLVFLRRDT